MTRSKVASTFRFRSTSTLSERHCVYTYLGVKPGDDLVVGRAKAVAPSSFDITVTVPASAVPAASQFFYNASCYTFAGLDTDSRTGTLKLHTGCTTADIYVIAKDSHYVPIASSYAKAQPVAPGATITMAGPFTPVGTATLSVAHAPPSTIVTPQLDLVDNAFYPGETHLAFELPLVNGAGSRQYAVPPISGLAIEARLMVESSHGNQLFITRRAVPANPVIDLATEHMPRVTAAGTFAATTSTVTWLEDGVGADTSAVIVSVKAGTTRDFTRVAVGPKTGASLRLPRLPASLAVFNIAEADQVSVIGTALGKFPRGYDGVRPHVFDRLSGAGAPELFDTFAGLDFRSRLTYVPEVGDVAAIASY